MKSGVFISFEGIDGAGKSSHIATLARALRDAGHEVLSTREPGGTPLAERLRALLLQERMDTLTEALLMFAARRDHLCQCIAPALARGQSVLCDRFSDASFAYQGAGRGLDWQVLTWMEQWAQTGWGVNEVGNGDSALLQPDLTLWLDLPPEVAAARLATARVPDRFEVEPVSFFARVAQGYARRAAAAPQRFVRIDAQQPVQQVARSMLAAVAARGWLRQEVLQQEDGEQ